jgi:hypothetical protein
MHFMHVPTLSILALFVVFPQTLRAQAHTGAALVTGFSALQNPPGDAKAEYEKRKKEAEGNSELLWKLHEWCEAYGMKNEARSTLRAILKLEPGDRKAHELLGHVEHEGKWHDNAKKLEEYKAKQLEAEAKATGKAIYKGELVDPADLEFLQKGMVKDASGKWIDAEMQKKIAEGWVRQDLTWVPPAEAENIAKGLWKCGEKWFLGPGLRRPAGDVVAGRAADARQPGRRRDRPRRRPGRRRDRGGAGRAEHSG